MSEQHYLIFIFSHSQYCSTQFSKLNVFGVQSNFTICDNAGSKVSWVLTAFFIGYAFFQMLGGRLAEIFGTKLVFGLSQLGEDLQKLCGSFEI